MALLPVPARKVILTVHVVSSVGWTGAVAAFVAVAALGWVSRDASVAPGVYAALRLVMWAVIVPSALLGFVSGLLQSLGTPWGLVRHWWVVAKLVLTVLATGVLLLHTQVADRAAVEALRPVTAMTEPLRMQLLVDAAGGLAVLVLITALSVVKPAGATGLGRARPPGR
jgi:hypothetical protein